jgi:hypothetical protein
VNEIGYAAFWGTSWYDDQPDGVIYAGLVAYDYKGKDMMSDGTNIVLRDGTVGIADYAFEKCTKLAGITIPNSITSIGAYAFSGCTGLNEISLPNSLTSIRNYAFSNCTALTTSLTLPSTVTYIGDYAFNNCTNLAGSVTIPKVVTYVGKQAFGNVSAIESVVCKAETPPTWSDKVIFTTNVYTHAPLYVPIDSKNAYMADQSWGQFSTINGYVNEDNPFEDADYLRCDVNCDGKVNIVDVITVIDAILTHKE